MHNIFKQHRIETGESLARVTPPFLRVLGLSWTVFEFFDLDLNPRLNDWSRCAYKFPLTRFLSVRYRYTHSCEWRKPGIEKRGGTPPTVNLDLFGTFFSRGDSESLARE